MRTSMRRPLQQRPVHRRRCRRVLERSSSLAAKIALFTHQIPVLSYSVNSLPLVAFPDLFAIALFALPFCEAEQGKI